MKVTVKLFAAARELAGADHMTVDLPVEASIGALRERMRQESPALAPLLPHAMFAVDATYAGDETSIPAGAEVACIPPVSGG